MFNTKSFDVTSFNSELCATKPEICTNIQTTDIIYAPNSAQTSETRSIGVQTMNEERMNVQVDYDKLADFLKKVTPGILEALDDAYNTNAFDDYSPNMTESSSSNMELLKKLSIAKESDTQVKISDLSWSTAGGTLAVGLSHIYHEAWCNHLSTIQLFNLTIEHKFPDVPNKVLETSGCITALCYHPTELSIIAAGLANWDVLLWNLRDDDSITPIHVYTHSDSVSQVQWTPRSLNEFNLLVSSSKDGYISIHKLATNFTNVQLYKRFKIIKERNPVENARPRSSSGTRERAAEAGLCITSFDFSPRCPSIFIVGTLCGGIYKCSLDSITPIEGDTTLIDPIIDEYERHKGSITCIKCSPLRNLFISSGTDKEIRIYSFDDHVNQHCISIDNTIVGLTWTIGNQDVFAAYGVGALIKFYNIMDGKTLTHPQLQATSAASISILRLNSKRDILAIGDVHANVEIWKFSRRSF